KIRNYDHACQLIFEYIEGFYNTVRIHSHCDYLSPKEHETNYKLAKANT
ncbi:IS3 family transposase, partial [[Clostridium] spiroforme]|nr:IS3 family transposase [Thomasclavelia spiroformis]